MRRAVRPLLRIFLVLAWLATAAPALADTPPFPKPIADAIASAKASMMEEPADVFGHVARAEALAAKVQDPQQRAMIVATARWLAAEARLRTNNADAAGPLLVQGLKLIRPIQAPIKLRGDLLMSQGTLFMLDDKAADALKNFQTAYGIFGAVKEPRSQAIALQNIGALYSSAHDDARAERYYRQAASVYDGDPMLSLSLHNSRGNVLMGLERYAEAEAEFRSALRIAHDLSKPLLEARVLGNLARNEVEARNFDAARVTLNQGFALTKGENAVGSRRMLLATAARLAEDQGDHRAAARLIQECFDGLDLSTTSIDFRTAHLYAYRIFRALGDNKRALVHLEAVRRLSDEAAKVATTNSAALMAARFDYANQELTIQKLTTEQLRKTAEFQRTLFLSLGGATIVVIALLTFGLITIRRSRNQVRDANVVLNTTNIALEKALKAKTEFLATTSHEIRTPLNGILGMTQVMLADPKLKPEMRDRIGIVHGAGITMRSLVDDILDVAKMETGNMTVDSAPMDLRAMLGEVTRIWEEQARAKGLEFRLELTHAPSWIQSDAGRLRQIIFNLLSNAIKFTERGSVVVRAVDEGEGESRRLKLTIIDTGIGIPEDKFEEIFESFRQVDASTTRQFGGTGLGLTICRNLARALGGDIAVASTAGQGSSFTVDLPLVPAEAPAAAAAETKSGGTMLILDRNPIARSMLRTLFEPRVARLCFAASPEEAVATIESGGVTRLLIDEATLKAGESDPFDALKALSVATQGIPVAILWLKPDAEIQSQLLDAGATQVIEKPIASAALVEALIPGGRENSAGGGADPLVSQAA